MTRPLPVHPTMRHPRTGQPLQALGFTRRGQAIWPVMGAADPPADPPKPPQDEQLGDGGKKALAEERKARQTAERELARYRKAEQDKADAEKTELQKASETAAAAETRATEAEARALRLEVAAAKGLPLAMAKRLQGTTRDELEADADELLAAVPPKTAGDPPARPGPKPDPSQGARGEPKTRPTSLGAAVAAALKKT